MAGKEDQFMKSIKSVVWLACLLAACLALVTGCQPKNAATTGGTASSSGAYLTLKDSTGETVSLAKKPERVVVLSPSLLEFVDAAGGTIVGRADARESQIPARFRSVDSVGHVYNINIEKVVALKPDLVLANKNQHLKFRDILKTNHIPVLYLQPKTYEDVKEALGIVGKVYGSTDKVNKKIASMDEEIAALRARLPKVQEKIVILHATPSTVTVELDNSIAGSVAKLLGFTNVASGSQAIEGRPDKTPYSMEALVEKDPDVLFITSMGEQSKIEARLKKDVQSNPAWHSLRAVRTGKVFVLPESLFLLNPGLKYPEAVKFMAKDLYPEVLGK
jgi:iron complex transport system substrate-binding protein